MEAYDPPVHKEDVARHVKECDRKMMAVAPRIFQVLERTPPLKNLHNLKQVSNRTIKPAI